MTLERLENESDEDLILRVCALKDKIGTWNDVADILNEITGHNYGESAYRKRYQIYKNMSNVNEDNSLQIARRELEAEKIQYRDERNAWNKQNYINARVSQKLDYLESALQDIGCVHFSDYAFKNNNVSDNDLLVILSDFHIGQCFDSAFGKYNSDIAKSRLSKLLFEVKNIQKIHKCENLFVSIQGDLISGNIHHTIAVTNRENIIDQIKTAAELLTSFIYEASQYFNNTTVVNVSGNHSRMTKKDEALHDERLDDLIGWIVKNSLSHVSDIDFKTNNYDIGIAEFSIRGNKYVSVHGDYDSYSDAGLSKLCMMLGFMPHAVLYGHLHTPAIMESHGVKMVRGGSLSGSGDDYTVEKRLYGKPSQMICVCNNSGIKCYYPIELD